MMEVLSPYQQVSLLIHLVKLVWSVFQTEADGIFISVGSDAVKVTKDTWADKGFTFKTEKT